MLSGAIFPAHQKVPASTVGRPKATIATLLSDFELKVSEYIESTGVSYKELGEASGVHPSQISKFMKGERGLSSLSIGRIVDALGSSSAAHQEIQALIRGSPRTTITNFGVRGLTG